MAPTVQAPAGTVPVWLATGGIVMQADWTFTATVIVPSPLSAAVTLPVL